MYVIMSESQSSESFVSLTHIQKQLEQKWKHLVALALIWLHADYQQRTQQRLRFYLTRQLGTLFITMGIHELLLL